MHLSLDTATLSRNLTATLNYLKPGPEKPAYYVVDPPPGVPRWNGVDDPREVFIEDARGRETEFTLDRNGFALVESPTAVSDFYDPEEIKRVYYPEVEQLLRDKLGRAACSFSTTTCATQGGKGSPRHRDKCTTTTP
jgi:hypothetical protein